MEDKELTDGQVVELFEEFVRKTPYYKLLLKSIREGQKSLIVDFSDLDRYNTALGDALLERPEATLELFEEGLTNLDLPVKEKLHVRFFGLPVFAFVRLKDLRAKHLNKFISVDGLIRQASEVRPEAAEVVFECLDCQTKTAVIQTGETIKRPARCVCGKKNFLERDKSFKDVQSLKLEEAPEQLEGGEQPSRLDVLIKDDLVEPELRRKLTPGNQVKITGVLKEKPMVSRIGSKFRRFDIYIEANNVESMVQEFEKIELTPADEAEVKNLAKDPRIIDKLTESIAPSIFGHREVKEAIALQLFGGVTKTREDGVRTRGDIHVFLVGDPGSGKSQILRYVAKLAPKSMYVSGKGASGAGLTAVVVRDEFLRGWALEAGAVVLCNKGLLALDEMDKMTSEDRVAMHEVMEQGTVSIAKANIHAQLRAETTILAAANPKFSRFDPYRPIGEQIDMPDTLLSRFDLVFPIRDVPSKDRDSSLADHILKLHKDPTHVIKTAIPTENLKKYVAYAKKHYKPKLTTEALEEIKAFFVELRGTYSSEEGTPTVSISPRQLEALIRLSEASAKMRLSNTVVKEDARRAIDLLKFCMFQIGIDPATGKLDIDRIEGGMPSSKRSKLSILIQLIKELEKDGKNIPIQKVYENASGKGLTVDEVREFMEELKRKGEVFEPRNGEIQRIG